jgi:hypothetical protein
MSHLPPHITIILQPMDQGIIETPKKLYGKQLLRRLSLCDGDENDVLSFYKSIDLKECACMLADPWSSIKA